MTDPIADFLTRIRNAVKANHKVVEAPGSKIDVYKRQKSRCDNGRLVPVEYSNERSLYL